MGVGIVTTSMSKATPPDDGSDDTPGDGRTDDGIATGERSDVGRSDAGRSDAGRSDAGRTDGGPIDDDPTDDGRESALPDEFDRTPPVPEPVSDETTVELVRDAIGVARGELSDEQFSRKYGTVSEGGEPESTATDG